MDNGVQGSIWKKKHKKKTGSETIASYFGVQKMPTDPYSLLVAAMGNHQIELRFQSRVLVIK